MDFKVVIFAFLCGLAIASCESDYYTYPVADEWKQCAWKFEDQRDQGQLRVIHMNGERFFKRSLRAVCQ